MYAAISLRLPDRQRQALQATIAADTTVHGQFRDESPHIVALLLKHGESVSDIIDAAGACKVGSPATWHVYAAAG